MNYKLSIGEELPNFKLKSTDNKSISTDNFSDKDIIIVIFMCNHCPYVKSYLKRIIDIQNDYENKNVQVIAINSNNSEKYPEDSFENMVLLTKEKHFNFPYLYDEKQKIAESFGASYTPEIFVFNRNRKLAYSGRIDDNWKIAEEVKKHDLRYALDELIEKGEVTNPETYAIGCTIKWK